jgi:hypothetical protein
MLVLAAVALTVAGEPRALAQHQDNDRQWRGRQRLQGPGPHGGDWLRQHQGQPPQEQERALRNDPNFRQLPPERQQQLVNRLRDFNSRPPEQREQMLNRWETWEHLPQDKRQQLRSMWGQMRDLPDDRRFAVRQAARQMSGMNPAERDRWMNSPQFQRRFSPQEQNLVRGLADMEPSR